MIFDLIDAVAGAVNSGREMNESIEASDARKKQEISDSNKGTAKKVAGIAAVAGLVALGINHIANKNGGKDDLVDKVITQGGSGGVNPAAKK